MADDQLAKVGMQRPHFEVAQGCVAPLSGNCLQGDERSDVSEASRGRS